MYHPVRGRLEAGFTQPLGDKFMLQVDLRDSLHEENGDKNIAWRNLPPIAASNNGCRRMGVSFRCGMREENAGSPPEG